MPVLRETTWAKLPFEDYRPRFFIESWWALLNRRTPHFYQARLMTVFSLLRELSQLIDEALSDERHARTLLTSAHEAKAAISSDKEFRQLVPEQLPLLEAYLGQFPAEQSKKIPATGALRRTKQLVDTISAEEDRYLDLLIGKLTIKLTDEGESCAGTDEHGKYRTLNEIHSLTSRFLSTLLARGYSSTYLYNRAELLTHVARYKSRSFPEQLQRMFERLRLKSTTYRVVLPIHCRRRRFLEHDRICGLRLCTATAELQKDLRHFDGTLDTYNAFLVGEFAAPDYISAAWHMHNRSQKVRDLSVFEYKRDIIDFGPQFLVVHEDGVHSHHHNVKVALLESLVIKRSDLYSEDMSDLLNRISHTDSLKPGTVEAVERIFRYYRLGIVESTFESKILSMWIALEAVFETESNDRIDLMLELVPSLYAYDSLVKRVRYIHDLLSRYGIQIPEDLEEEVTDTVDLHSMYPDLHLVYSILSEDSWAERLYDAAGPNDYAKYRISEVHRDFKSRKSLRQRVETSRTDVMRQLLRIYYIRNHMVHRAGHGGVDVRVYGHLCEYIGCVLSELVIGLSLYRNGASLREVLRGYMIGVERQFVVWEQKDVLDFQDVLFLNPVIPSDI